MQTEALGLPAALAEVHAEQIHETSAMIFLKTVVQKKKHKIGMYLVLND